MIAVVPPIASGLSLPISLPRSSKLKPRKVCDLPLCWDTSEVVVENFAAKYLIFNLCIWCCVIWVHVFPAMELKGTFNGSVDFQNNACCRLRMI